MSKLLGISSPVKLAERLFLDTILKIPSDIPCSRQAFPAYTHDVAKRYLQPEKR